MNLEAEDRNCRSVFVTLCLKRMLLSTMNREAEDRNGRFADWQQAEEARLYSDLLQASEPFDLSASRQR